MPKKRPHERPEGAHFGGSTDAIETRIPKLGEDVRALRKELTVTSKRLAAVNDKRQAPYESLEHQQQVV